MTRIFRLRCPHCHKGVAKNPSRCPQCERWLDDNPEWRHLKRVRRRVAKGLVVAGIGVIAFWVFRR